MTTTLCHMAYNIIKQLKISRGADSVRHILIISSIAGLIYLITTPLNPSLYFLEVPRAARTVKNI